jgi:hypothetical protein
VKLESDIEGEYLLKNDNNVCVVKYGYVKRLFSIGCFLLVCLSGTFFMFVNEVVIILFGMALILISLINIIDILFFKVLTIDSDYLTKEWYLFGKRTIKMSNLIAKARDRLWSGSIMFGDKDGSILRTFYMNFETFPAKDNGCERIKEVLIKNDVIKEDDIHWDKDGVKKRKMWCRIFAAIKNK